MSCDYSFILQRFFLLKLVDHSKEACHCNKKKWLRVTCEPLRIVKYNNSNVDFFIHIDYNLNYSLPISFGYYRSLKDTFCTLRIKKLICSCL